MANVKSAIRQIRKDAKRRTQNRQILSALGTLAKKLVTFGSENRKDAEAFARTVVSKWDRAVARGIVPKGRANRKKARVAHFLRTLTQSP